MLQPLVTDQGRRCGFWSFPFDVALCEVIDLFSGHMPFGFLDAPFQGCLGPRVWRLSIKFFWDDVDTPRSMPCCIA